MSMLQLTKEKTMHAIEMKAQVTNTNEIILRLPEHIKDETVNVIIMYDKEKDFLPEKKQRKFGQFRAAKFFIADDFDSELPDSFWLGEEA